MSGSDSHSYPKLYQHQLPAHFQNSQSVVPPFYIHESLPDQVVSSGPPERAIKEEAGSCVLAITIACVFQLLLPELCLHGNHFNKQLRLVLDVRGAEKAKRDRLAREDLARK